MYLVETKTVITQAMKRAFEDDGLADADFRNIPVSIEYPVEKQGYPSIWVDYDPTSALATAGIGHVEDSSNGAGAFNRAYRWRFAGNATYTVVAMTSMERDRLFDAVVKVIAFSQSEDNPTPFRQAIEDNPHIGMNLNFDTIEQRGFGAGQGTPWGTDDMIYEATLSVSIEGEFLVDASGTLLPLSAVKLYTWVTESLEFDPTLGEGTEGWIG